MNIVIGALILVLIAIAFVATVFSGLIDLIFFYKHKDTYREILKFGLIGEAVGLFIMLLTLILNKQNITAQTNPEVVVLTPFFLMVIGLCVGAILVFRNRQKINSKR